MGQFIEAIRKLREEMEKQEGEKMNLLEKISDSIVKGEGEANILQDESVAPKTIDFILRVNITENTQNKK